MTDASPTTPPAAPQKSALNGFIYLALAAIAVMVVLQRLRDVPSAVDWGADLQAALASAKSEQRPVLLNFSAPGCTYCRQMEREVFPQPAVLAEIAKFIPVKIDAWKDRGSAERYGVEGLPTYVVARSDGSAVAAISGFTAAERFLSFLRVAGAEALRVERPGAEAPGTGQ